MQVIRNLKTNASTYSAAAINSNSKIYMDCIWDRWPLTNEDIKKYRAIERARAKERERVSPTVKVSQHDRRVRKSRENVANVFEVPIHICTDTAEIEAMAEAEAEGLRLRDAKAKSLDDIKSKVDFIVGGGGITKAKLIIFMTGQKIFTHIAPAWSKHLNVDKMYDHIIEWDKANQLDKTTTLPTINSNIPNQHYPTQQALLPTTTTITQQPLSTPITTTHPNQNFPPGYFTELLYSHTEPTQYTMESQFVDTQYIMDTPSTHQYHPDLFSQFEHPNIDTIDTPSTFPYYPGS